MRHEEVAVNALALGDWRWCSEDFVKACALGHGMLTPRLQDRVHADNFRALRCKQFGDFVRQMRCRDTKELSLNFYSRQNTSTFHYRDVV